MLSKLIIRDTTGKKSVTVTAFIYGFVIVNLKLLFSGVTVGSIVLSQFSGTEYAAAVAALGSVYILRRYNSDSKSEKPTNE
jgi:hypothetical protein